MQQRSGELEGAKGLALVWQAWLPDRDPKAVVILSHGLAEHSGRYSHVAACLVRHGYAVYALDHRGHGRSQGRRAQIGRMAYVIEDLHALVGLVRSEQPARPLFLLGHSMGGAIAVNYALEHPNQLAGLVLSAPAVVIETASAVRVRVGKVLSAFAPGFPLLALDGTAVSRDPAVVHAYDADPRNYRGKIPVRTLAELVDTAEQLPDRLSDLRLPILLLQGTADRLVPLSASRLVHDRVSSSDKTLRLYEGLYHEVFNEPERGQVLADLCDWLERHA